MRIVVKDGNGEYWVQAIGEPLHGTKGPRAYFPRTIAGPYKEIPSKEYIENIQMDLEPVER